MKRSNGAVVKVADVVDVPKDTAEALSRRGFVTEAEFKALEKVKNKAEAKKPEAKE